MRVLLRLGYQVAAREHGRVEVARDWQVVSVPNGEPLSHDDVVKILRDAGISQLEFLEGLEKLSIGQMRVAAPAVRRSPA